jgi:hypothetical protein
MSLPISTLTNFFAAKVQKHIGKIGKRCLSIWVKF